MADRMTPKNTQRGTADREDRLKAALKANLGRRKAQSRKRAEVSEAENTTPGTSGQEKDA
ncbi:MAG: hypothetical protein V2I76_07720 [Roseobacter sp.]|jgi:hypothetical protein|nr:hypothetical protein [Roseobacter sp.]